MEIQIFKQVRYGYHPTDLEGSLYSFDGHPYPAGPQTVRNMVHASVGEPTYAGRVWAPEGSVVDQSEGGEWLLYCPGNKPFTAREVADPRMNDRLPTSFTPAS